MLRTETILLVLSALVALPACSGGDGEGSQQVMLEVNHARTRLTQVLFDESGRTAVGQLALESSGDLINLEVRALPGYRLTNVRACATPDLGQHDCLPWAAPHNCGHNWRSFTFDVNTLEPGLCAPRHRVFLRYQVVQTELLSSLQPPRRLTSAPNWVAASFYYLY